jgi:hypothetical protein
VCYLEDRDSSTISGHVCYLEDRDSSTISGHVCYIEDRDSSTCSGHVYYSVTHTGWYLVAASFTTLALYLVTRRR